MKKIFLVAIFFLTAACQAQFCRFVPHKQEEAQRMYNAFGTKVVSVTPQQGYELFGDCYYELSSTVYVYETLWNKEYILVTSGEVITFTDKQLKNGKKSEPLQATQPTEPVQQQMQQQIQQQPVQQQQYYPQQQQPYYPPYYQQRQQY